MGHHRNRGMGGGAVSIEDQVAKLATDAADAVIGARSVELARKAVLQWDGEYLMTAVTAIAFQCEACAQIISRTHGTPYAEAWAKVLEMLVQFPTTEHGPML
jgi:hypothetical protein